MVFQVASIGLGFGVQGALAAEDSTPPAGGLLTVITNNHPSPGITVATPTAGVYAVTPALTGEDQLTSLTVVVTDAGLNTTAVPAYVDGTENGTMVHGSGDVWTWTPGSGVNFTEGSHYLTATFSDNAGNTTLLRANFTTDRTAPDLATVTATINGVEQTKTKAESLTARKDQSVGTITAALTESATLVGGTGTITISGPLGPLGEVVTNAPYGTFTVSGSTVTITPYSGNAALAKIGTFTFTVAANQIQDVAGNRNIETNFTMEVSLSNVATVTSSTYTVSAGGTTNETISNVQVGTSKTDFLAALTKGQDDQTWIDTGIANPVVTGNVLVVTAQGGSPTVTYTITVNTQAPPPVTNLIVTINSSGKPVLTWVNPTAGTYSGLYIYRDGVYYAPVGVGTATFTDLAVEPGKTYSYMVSTLNSFGGTPSSSTSITIPRLELPTISSNLIASSGISDSEQISTGGAEASKEVKANIDLNKKDDKQKDESSGLPAWGIFMLVLLAVVGGYLFYTQKSSSSKTNAVPTAPKTTQTKPKTKPRTTPKKK